MEQKMKFEQLYRNVKEAVRARLTSMWCGETRNESQRLYAEQLKNIIAHDMFAPRNAMPLVQCMDPYKAIKEDNKSEIKNIVGNLWRKNYPPYEHQYECWKALSETDEKGRKKSIVVTSGTGSGKTECFILPLVHDLMKNSSISRNNQIEALVLYPLNALMEDQIGRWNECLEGTNLKFAVFNGSTPEQDDRDNEVLTRRLKYTRERYPNMIATRNEIRATPPNILLTNPSMLEHMMIRRKDNRLFTDGSLKWIVIDETHTYTGAGAAELAMLIRRVLIAFNTSPNDVRFATSSATIGNSESDRKALIDFVCGITGQKTSQIVAIDGERNVDGSSENSEVRRCQHILHNNNTDGYIRLDALFSDEGETIEQKLAKLDKVCEEGLKAKVHFFFRVLNNGLKVRLDTYYKGNPACFKIYSEIPASDDGKVPYIELMRCQHCGEFVAIGQGSMTNNTYKALTSDDRDVFDFSDENKEKLKSLVFGLSNKETDDNENNIAVDIDRNIYSDHGQVNNREWHVVMNRNQACTNCAGKFSKSNDINEDDEDSVDVELQKLISFRISSDYVARIITRPILNELQTAKNTEEYFLPHNGQQFISFVDSRQAASGSTLSQNLEEERLWVQSRLFHELNRRKIDGDDTPMTWSEVFDFLYEQPELNELCWQFIDRSDNSEEKGDDDEEYREIDTEMQNRYLYTVMIEQLSKRPRYAAAPETMGLFTSCYPKLNKITRLPDAVEKFNSGLSEDSRISLDDWKNLLTIFMDRSVRSNMSIYIKENDRSTIDIFKCQRFSSQKSPRRPVAKPTVNKTGNSTLVIRLLAKLYNIGGNLNDVIKSHEEELNSVCDALWTDLTKTTQLLQPSERLEDKKKRNRPVWKPDLDKGTTDGLQYRLNVFDIAFRLYGKTYLSSVSGTTRNVLRPFDLSFKGFNAPYGIVYPEKIDDCNWCDWLAFPYIKGLKDGKTITKDKLEIWAKENRNNLWNNGLWGEDGTFSDRLNNICSYPEIYIQAEHTAQVDKQVKQDSQRDFKEHRLNILACSTTMEMGVDLGDLEAVLLNSVPPQPANYKQRAGRSGRNLQMNKSICITLCGSDAVGLRTLRNPLGQIIMRHTAVPTVDLNSQQVIQRHVNSFLLRESGVLNSGSNPSITMEVIDFFTHKNFTFGFGQDGKGRTVRDRRSIKDSSEGSKDVFLDEQLISLLPTRTEDASSCYSDFLLYIDNLIADNYSSIKNQMEKLLNDTCFQDKEVTCILQSKEELRRCKDELLERISPLHTEFLFVIESSGAKNGLKLCQQMHQKFGLYLMYKYSDILSKKLIEFLSTSRFLPNANMPVNIIEFDVNRGEGRYWGYKLTTNPSYSLREAVSQYTPGSPVVLSNRVYNVRGLLSTGQYRKGSMLKKLYTDGDKTLIDNASAIQNKQDWPVSGRDYVELVEPYSFIPDANETVTRTIDGRRFSRVNAQLVGTDEWHAYSTHRMFRIRNNRESGLAKIFYYNEGFGFGWCYCTKCGKTVLEDHACKKNPLFRLPNGYNDQKIQNEDNHSTLAFHYRINVKAKGKKDFCLGSMREENIRRNVLIGGLIQTDYSEISIKKEINGVWVDHFKEYDRPLLNTLGIVFCHVFAQYQGIEANDIDFIVMQNGHICLFDTNLGGAGYCNRLVNMQIMSEVLSNSLMMLKEIKCKDELLDKFTLKYLDNIDIKAAIKWLQDVIEENNKISDAILTAYPNARTAYMEDIEMDAENKHCTIFVNSDWEKWNYDDGEVNWKMRMSSFRERENCDVCIIGDFNKDTMPMPIYSILQNISDWAELSRIADEKLKTKAIPVAFVGKHLYVTDERNFIGLNSSWGCDRLYCIDLNVFPYEGFLAPIDIHYIPQNIAKFTIKDAGCVYSNSQDLGKIIESHCESIISQFISYCGKTDAPLTVTYQDEHLKSVMGMVTTLQFIKFFAEKFGKKIDSVSFLMEQYYYYETRRDISYDMGDTLARDEKLKKLSDGYFGDIKPSINSLKKGSLPHWRSLTFECGKKELCFYPNGGIINGWRLDKNHRDEYTIETTDINSNIPLFRQQIIMYDVEIKDVTE